MSAVALEVRTARHEELEAAFAIRREVFCGEQQLFADCDQDEHDHSAVHLVAVCDGVVVGTVRLYERDAGVWVGGRLAVRSDNRGAAGFELVRHAVREAALRGAQVFLAVVQVRNERFFHRLGWVTVVTTEGVAGVPHVLMKAPDVRLRERGARAS